MGQRDIRPGQLVRSVVVAVGCHAVDTRPVALGTVRYAPVRVDTVRRTRCRDDANESSVAQRGVLPRVQEGAKQRHGSPLSRRVAFHLTLRVLAKKLGPRCAIIAHVRVHSYPPAKGRSAMCLRGRVDLRIAGDCTRRMVNAPGSPSASKKL